MSRMLHLRLCNDELWCSVTQQQWDKFLRSQLRALAHAKNPLTGTRTLGLTSSLRGNVSNGTVQETGRGNDAAITG